MLHRLAIAAAIVAVITMGVTSAPKSTPPPTLPPHGTEIAFVNGVQSDLAARFPTTADATKAGYFRYTNEDSTGAISYVNLQWQSKDTKSPSQLWYDVKGNLLGADFSVLKSNSPDKPSIWGVDASRWQNFGAHVHYVLVDANGKETYSATSMKKFTAAGGNLDTPDASTIAKMGLAKTAAQVTHVFVFPSIWDLEVWVKANPNGAFTDANPSVIPSANAEKGDM